MTGTVLVLGASGRFGRHSAEAFWNAGWAVRLFDRRTDDLVRAADGADVIVNGLNPAYPDWAADVPRLTESVIQAARSSDATVIFPGNVYVFGEETEAPFHPDTPHDAANPLGRIRVEMEAAYKEAGVRTIVLRAGDFLDTEPSGNWFDKIMVAQLSRGTLVYPGPLDRKHAWAFLPDLARAAAELAEKRDALPAFADVPFPGYTMTGHEMTDALGFALGRDLRVRPMGWLALRVLAPVWPMGRALVEMSYLWRKPHSLAPETFDSLLPDFQSTPIDVALRRAAGHKIDPDQMMPRGAVALVAN